MTEREQIIEECASLLERLAEHQALTIGGEYVWTDKGTLLTAARVLRNANGEIEETK